MDQVHMVVLVRTIIAWGAAAAVFLTGFGGAGAGFASQTDATGSFQVFTRPQYASFGDNTARLYGMSETLTVVPEPTTLAMWLGFSGLAGLVFWRKRRKSS